MENLMNMLNDIKNFIEKTENKLFVVIGENSSGKTLLKDVLEKNKKLKVFDNFCYYKDNIIWRDILKEINNEKNKNKYIIITHDTYFCEQILESLSEYKSTNSFYYILMFSPFNMKNKDKEISLYLPAKFPEQGSYSLLRREEEKGFNKKRCIKNIEKTKYWSEYLDNFSNESNNDIDRTIKEIRQELGLSQSQFAKEFNLSVRNLQEWEQNRKTPPNYLVKLIERIIKAENIKKNR